MSARTEAEVLAIERDLGRRLREACRAGLDEEVRNLIDKRDVPINSKDGYGRTPLIQAASKGHIRVVRLLLSKQNEIRINDKDGSGMTALAHAVQHGYTDCVQSLIQDKQVNVNCQDGTGLTPLMMAACSKDVSKRLEIVGMLLDSKDIEVNVEDMNGQTALMKAAELGAEDVVNALLGSEEIDVNAKDQLGRTALMLATARGHPKVVKYLLHTAHDNRTCEEVEINEKDHDGRTALMWASHNPTTPGHEECLRLLLRRNEIEINVQDKDRQWNALMHAAVKGRSTLVKVLLDRYKPKVPVLENYFPELLDPSRTDRNGRTALQLAAEYGCKPSTGPQDDRLGHQDVVLMLLHRDREYILDKVKQQDKLKREKDVAAQDRIDDPRDSEISSDSRDALNDLLKSATSEMISNPLYWEIIGIFCSIDVDLLLERPFREPSLRRKSIAVLIIENVMDERMIHKFIMGFTVGRMHAAMLYAKACSTVLQSELGRTHYEKLNAVRNLCMTTARNLLAGYDGKDEEFRVLEQRFQKETVLELAIDNEDINFMSQPYVSKYIERLWRGNVTNGVIDILANVGFCPWFEDSNPRLGIRKKDFWTNPNCFLGTPRGKFFLENVMWIVFLSVYSYVVTTNLLLNDTWSYVEAVMWVLWVGFAAAELEQVIDEGRQYWTRVWNYLDITIHGIFLFTFTIRMYELFFETYTSRVLGYKFNPSSAIYFAVDLLCCSSIILWLRVLAVYEIHHEIGPLLAAVKRMYKDFVVFVQLNIIIMLGFSIMLQGLGTGADGLGANMFFLFRTMLGEIVFDPVMDHPIGPVMLGLYMVVSNILMLNLLIAVLSTTMAQVQQESLHTFKYGKAVTVLEFQQATDRLAPPLNLLTYLPLGGTFRKFIATAFFSTVILPLTGLALVLHSLAEILSFLKRSTLSLYRMSRALFPRSSYQKQHDDDENGFNFDKLKEKRKYDQNVILDDSVWDSKSLQSPAAVSVQAA